MSDSNSNSCTSDSCLIFKRHVSCELSNKYAYGRHAICVRSEAVSLQKCTVNKLELTLSVLYAYELCMFIVFCACV